MKNNMFEYDESVELLREIRDFMSDINDNLESVKEECQEINSKLSDINGAGVFEIADVVNLLIEIDNGIKALS